MIQDGWKRVAGIHIQDDGDLAAVWMALDGDSDVIHLYDCCVFKREVLAVIAEGMNARGRWIPVGWTNKELADKLLDRGCNMQPDPSDDSESMAEIISRDIWARMRSGRFKVDRRLKEWLDEYKTFNRQDSKVPRDTHPLMAATRHAIDQLQYAKAESTRSTKINYPKLAKF